MTNIELKDYSEADLIRMQEGKKELPVGISRMSNGRNGYRLHRTIKGKTYRFGTFQNLEHALRVNEYIGRLIEDFRELLDAQPLSNENLEDAIQNQNRMIERRFDLLFNEIHLNLKSNDKKKSFWQQIFGR